MEPESQISFDDSWPRIEALLGGGAAIDAVARSTRALVRPRVVRDGGQLLRLALNYAATGRSLRTTAAWSEAALGIVLSDVALLGRLREAGDFLASLCAQLLVQVGGEAVATAPWQGPPIRLVDSSVFAGPGQKGGQHRLHASYDPVRQVFDTFEVTPISKGESLTRAGIEPGAIGIGDRNFAKTPALRQLDDNGAFFVTRAGIRSMRMIDRSTGERLTGKAILAALGDARTAELEVELVPARTRKHAPGHPLKARLLVLRASEAATRRETARIERSRRLYGTVPAEETKSMAGVVMIITNLPGPAWTIERVAILYRLRWQIELAFKTLKSTFGMRDVPAKDPKLARTWILANLAVALLANLLVSAMERAVSPSGVEKQTA
jgi:Transposase DDE domain